MDVGSVYGILLEKIMLRKSINRVGIEISDVKNNYGISIGLVIRKGNS